MGKRTKANTEQPANIAELLKNGTAVLSAKSREELAEMVNAIPTSCKYSAGAIGKDKETGIFSLRLDLIND